MFRLEPTKRHGHGGHPLDLSRDPRRLRGWLRAPALLASFVVGLSLLVGAPAPALATKSASGLDVDPETEVVYAGLPAVLTAFIDASDHDPDAGDDGRTVRFFFQPGSPNDTPASPDLACTVVLGSCSVTYVPAVNGADLICATTHNHERHCDEPWDAPDGGGREDVVRRIVVNGVEPTRSASPVPAPMPLPTPDPTLDLTPVPAPVATPVLARASTPSPVPVPKDGHPYVEAATADVARGQVVTLSVWMLRSDGSRATKKEGDAKVNFYFLAGSANEQRTQRGADLTCRTGDDAFCTVSYVARSTGEDIICAYVGPPGRWQTGCSEPPEARDLDNDADVVRRRVADPIVTPLGPPPTPTAVATPDSTPTPAPTPPASEGLVGPAFPASGSSTPPGQAPAIAPGLQPTDPETQGEWTGTLWQVWSAVAQGVDRAVQPEAAATVATTFGFPLALMVAVLIFLVVQGLVDRRDPKLRRAPRTVIETMQKFRTEDEL